MIDKWWILREKEWLSICEIRLNYSQYIDVDMSCLTFLEFGDKLKLTKLRQDARVQIALRDKFARGMIENDFEVAVDCYDSLHIIVSLGTPKLFLCLWSSSFSFVSLSLSRFLPPSLSFSLYILILSSVCYRWMHQYYLPSFPLTKDSIWHSRLTRFLARN